MVDIYINSSEKHKEILGHFENENRIKDVKNAILQSSVYSKLIRTVTSKQKENIMSLITNVHGTGILNQFIKPNKVFCIKCEEEYIVDKCPLCNSDDQLWYINNDTYITNKSEECILSNVAILMDSVDNVINGSKYQYLLIRPPGHHCFNKGQGFCILNNVYMTAIYALNRGFKRVLIFDYDFHHFDGTAKLIRNNENIFGISIHAYGNKIYPGSGSRYDNRHNILNYPLHITCLEDYKKYDDNYCLTLFNNIIMNKIKEFNPDLILISNGLDAHKDDPIAGLNLTKKFYVDVCNELKTLNVPLIYVLEGGYNPSVITDVSLGIIDKLLEE